MKVLLQFFKKFPASVICYLLFTLLCLGMINMDAEYHDRLKHLPPGVSGIAVGGEGVTFGYFFFLIIAGIFLLVSIANALANKTGTKFYLWLSIVIVVQTLIVFKFG